MWEYVQHRSCFGCLLKYHLLVRVQLPLSLLNPAPQPQTDPTGVRTSATTAAPALNG